MVYRTPAYSRFVVMISFTVALTWSVESWPTPKPRVDEQPAPKPRQPEEVDWRGLVRMDETGTTIRKTAPPESPVTALVRSAPYRLHVATTNGRKVTITDAFTLERRRLFEAEQIRGYAFSGDGHWLYVVHGLGAVVAVEVRSARVVGMGQFKLAATETVIEVIGHGTASHPFVTIVLGKGPAPAVGRCGRWKRIRRIRLRAKRGGAVVKRVEIGPHTIRRRSRRKGTSPNTRFEMVMTRHLLVSGRGTHRQDRINAKTLPSGAFSARWSGDSRGVWVTMRRPARSGCRYRLDVRSYRQPKAQRASWRRQSRWQTWSLPKDIEIVRGDLAHETPGWAPDGIRLVGHGPRGVVLLEPLPRFGGHVSLIAPPSKLWPVVRPGIRGLVAGVGTLRLAELQLEQGNLAAARQTLASHRRRSQAKQRPEPAALARLNQRLSHLAEVRKRRTIELGGDLANR